MEFNDRHDPLLLTDVQDQQLPLSSQEHCPISTFTDSQITLMEDTNCYTPMKFEDWVLGGSNAEIVKDPIAESIINDPFHSLAVSENILMMEDPNCCTPIKIDENIKDPVAQSIIDGREMLGFSLLSPDLVICTGSPDIPRQSYGDSPEFIKGCSISLENGIKGSQLSPTAIKEEDLCLQTHFELPFPPIVEENPSLSSGEIGLLECSENSPGRKSLQGNGDRETELKEETRQVEELEKENEQKCKECAEAWKSLKDLQDELLRKSMHVGSLAFAIEGQVKEKTRWFSSLRDVTRKLKILKMDQIKVSEEASAFKQFQEEFADMSSTIQSKFTQVVELHEDLKIKFVKGAKERKELYNKVLDLKGNIRVFCRCRPLNGEEVASGASMAIDFEAAKDGELTVRSNGISKKTFKFDAIFSPQANQAEVFKDTAPLATSVLDGYNVCIFAYGQTGTGKTFTMEGIQEARGVNYRTLEELFHIIEERKNAVRYEVSVSVMEVYNEQIRDLLVSGSQQGVKRLEIKQVGEGVHHVPGLVEAHVSDMNGVWEALRTGSNARAVGSTNANEHSSRSHCIHCVMVKGENLLNGECTRSKLWLIDLAGSERIAKTEVQGERLKETQNINRSLSALGDVISALATKSSHIPFRNSKLTHLLQDSLGGDSKTLMFVQISPNENDLNETLCSLNFASRVRGIELGPAKKQVDSMELLKYKQMVEKGKQEIKYKDFLVKKMEDTIHGLDIKLKEKDTKYKSMQDKIKELESQLLVERKLARQHVDSKIAEQFRQKNEEQDSAASTRPPLASKSSSYKTYDDIYKFPLDISNSQKLLMTSCTPVDCPINHNDLTEDGNKENNPENVGQLVVPKRTGRASMCPVSQRTLAVAATQRRKTLVLTHDYSAFDKFLPEKKEVSYDDSKCLENSPTEVKGNAVKKLGSSVLRKSLQKKIYQSPKQQNVRRIGVNVGMERVRLSIGSRGRMMPKRMVHGNASRKVVPKENQQKQRWNAGTATTKVV